MAMRILYSRIEDSTFGGVRVESPRLYTSGEVQRLVGVSQQTLTYWNQSLLIKPHGRAAAGRGSRRLYTTLDVVQLKLIRRLRDVGVSLQKTRGALAFLANMSDEPAPLAELEVLTDGRRILVRRSNDSLVDPLTGQLVLRLPLIHLLTEVREGIASPPMHAKSSRERVALGRGHRS